MELSIFIDESGDFYECSKYYLMTLVLHEQHKSIERELKILDEAMDRKDFPLRPIHTSPLKIQQKRFPTSS